ncbi:MAG: Gfo/Idh/MocA family protein [Candidatus Omnitrophota bacterium]
MLNGAIIGFGKIAINGHAPAFQDPRIRERLTITAIVDPNPESWPMAEAVFPGVTCYPTVDDLLDRQTVDFVDICSPPVFHPEAIRKCSQRGIHLLCEKPLGTSPQDLVRLTELLGENRNRPFVFMPCHQYRYSPIWKRFKYFIDTAEDDSRFFLQFNIFRPRADQGYFPGNVNWRTERSIAGGGILADTGVHYLALCLWMLGGPIHIRASTLCLNHALPNVEDTAVVFLECQKGVADIVLTWGADRRANSARIVSRTGSLIYDGQSLEHRRCNDNESIPVPDASDKTTYTGMYVSLFDEFIGRVETKKNDSAWVQEALDTARILFSCYESAQTGQTISTKNTLNKNFK